MHKWTKSLKITAKKYYKPLRSKSRKRRERSLLISVSSRRLRFRLSQKPPRSLKRSTSVPQSDLIRFKLLNASNKMRKMCDCQNTIIETFHLNTRKNLVFFSAAQNKALLYFAFDLTQHNNILKMANCFANFFLFCFKKNWKLFTVLSFTEEIWCCSKASLKLWMFHGKSKSFIPFFRRIFLSMPPIDKSRSISHFIRLWLHLT